MNKEEFALYAKNITWPSAEISRFVQIYEELSDRFIHFHPQERNKMFDTLVSLVDATKKQALDDFMDWYINKPVLNKTKSEILSAYNLFLEENK